MSKLLESTNLNKSRFPKYKMASPNIDHIPSDIRKCLTAALCCEK